MKNVNKNAMHMLASYDDSYLVHHDFKNFTLDGSVPFTIEVSMVYQDSNHGSLYCREDGMDFGIRDACPYFKHPALGELNVPKSFALDRSYYHCLAVVFDGSTVKLYIHGFEIASRAVSNITPAGSGDFCIGKGFRGYIGCVRVLSKALTAAEIMRDQGEGFPENPACELWTDFSGVGYKDISRNAMELWRTGHDAHCANVVNCTVLDSNGLYTRTNAIDYQTGFSMTGKIYPDFARRGNFYLYCLHGDSGPYLQIYLTEKEDGYYLALDMNGTNLISETRVTGLRWTDYAVTVDISKGTACLYLDGVKCGEQTYSELKPFEKAKAIIGGKYYAVRASYEEAFAGLLDYCAEFDSILTDQAIDSYAEDQPYLFAAGLKALLLFGWGEPEDLYENAPLGEYGGGYFAVVADTNRVNAPVGLNWYVPDEDDAYWDSLSAYERWEDILLCDVFSETIETLTGIPMKADHQQSRQKSVRIQVGEEKAYWRGRLTPVEMEEFSRAPSPGRMHSVPERMTLHVNGAGYRALSQNPQLPCVTGIWSGIQLFFANHWKEILAGATLFTCLVSSIVECVKQAQKKRPKDKNARLEVKNITWNHNGDPARGSIHFHDSVKNINSPDSMVYAPNNTCINIKGVFVPSKLQGIKVNVEVTNKGTADYAGCLKLTDPDGNVAAKSGQFSVAKECSATVELTIERGKILGTGYAKKMDYYNIEYTEDGKDIFMIRCDYAYYTLLGEPISPWNNGRNEYDPSNIGYVSIPLLEICIDQFPMKKSGNVSADEDLLIKTIISGMNECRKLTYALQGEPHFSTPQLGFKFKKFVAAMQGTAASYLNCADCATIVSSLTAMHGMDYPMTILGVPFGRTAQSFFYCNQIQAITAETPSWGYPFDWNGAKGWGGFSFHMVNRSNESGISGDTKIYDACLKVDGGSYPGQPYPGNQNKSAKQPFGMRAYGSESPFVNVPPEEAYTEDVYRERLVYNGSEACFCSAAYRVLQIDTSVTDAVKRANMAAGENGFDIDQVFSGNSHVTEWELLDDMYDETEWSFQYDGQRMEICRYKMDGQEAEVAVGAVMRQFADPNSRNLSKSYPESCCFAIGESCYVIWKEGCVYRILGAQAKEVADCIYKA